MKTSELTTDIVRHAILPASAMKDQDATLKWLALPVELRGRSRAAERIAVLISGSNMPQRKEPLLIPVPTPVPPAPDAVKEDLPGGAVRTTEEAAPPSSPVVASVDIKEDGSVTVHPKRPSSFPPAPIEAPMAVELTAKDSADLTELEGGALSPEAALRAIRAIYKAWKGGTYVCGNAFRRMNEVESIIARAGF